MSERYEKYTERTVIEFGMYLTMLDIDTVTEMFIKFRQYRDNSYSKKLLTRDETDEWIDKSQSEWD